MLRGKNEAILHAFHIKTTSNGFRTYGDLKLNVPRAVAGGHERQTAASLVPACWFLPVSIPETQVPSLWALPSDSGGRRSFGRVLSSTQQFCCPCLGHAKLHLSRRDFRKGNAYHMPQTSSHALTLGSAADRTQYCHL